MTSGWEEENPDNSESNKCGKFYLRHGMVSVSQFSILGLDV